jgi:AcrR family transcriptional regulator
VKKPQAKARRTADEARADILDAAIQALSARGPDAIGLKEVAAAAGVSHALIIHYFGSYDGLVAATIRETMTRLRSHLVAQLATTAEPTVVTLLEAYLDTALDPLYSRLVTWALLQGHEAMTTYADLLTEETELIVTGIQGMLAGKVTPEPSRLELETVLVAIWSMAAGYVAGREFFWRAMGRTAGPKRDRDLRNAVTTLARNLMSQRLTSQEALIDE